MITGLLIGGGAIEVSTPDGGPFLREWSNDIGGSALRVEGFGVGDDGTVYFDSNALAVPASERAYLVDEGDELFLVDV